MNRGVVQPSLEPARPSLTAIQGLVHDVLDGVLTRMSVVLEAEVPFINEVSFHLHQMRGKLFRPALLALANRVDGTPDDREVDLGAVIEIIHLATLVHDDSIDQSGLRRGLPTLNSRWGHKVSIIMGDYLYSRAMAEITRIGDLRLIGLAARVTNDLTIGEMVEIAHHGRLVEDPHQYFFLIEKKTASLISTACEMGAVVGAPRYAEPLKAYGHRLGMAFQLIDDLMDYGGEQSIMGKPAGSDLREGQATFPLLAVLAHLSPVERRAVQAVFRGADGRPDGAGPRQGPGSEAVDTVVRLVQERGGIEATRRIAREYADRAREALEPVPPTPAREVLEAAVDYVLSRDR
ncbi:MAG TPA: polyprenyl synthetase family protein [Gemmatimonadota bacterium]|nr:polyprenyl synthetase family protein [Gemmatimonadota bacterium]